MRIRIRILLFSSVTFKMLLINSHKRSHKTAEIKVFFIFLLVDGRIRIQEAPKFTDPDAIADPEHWLQHAGNSSWLRGYIFLPVK
jgi:hypothetical protein